MYDTKLELEIRFILNYTSVKQPKFCNIGIQLKELLENIASHVWMLILYTIIIWYHNIVEYINILYN